nr:hypothetical protein [Lachnospiraceae bacterium]
NANIIESVFSDAVLDYIMNVGEIEGNIKFDVSDVENTLEADFDIDKEKFVELWQKNNGDKEYEPRCYKNDSFIAELNVDGYNFDYTISYKNHPEDSLDIDNNESDDEEVDYTSPENISDEEKDYTSPENLSDEEVDYTSPENLSDEEKYKYIVDCVCEELSLVDEERIDWRFAMTISCFDEKSYELGYITTEKEEAWLEEALRIAAQEKDDVSSDASYHKPKGEVELCDYKRMRFGGADTDYLEQFAQETMTMEEVFDTIIQDSEFKNISEDDLQDFIEETEAIYEKYACMHGIKYEDFIRMCAGTREEYDELLDKGKDRAVKLNLVINEIAENENISVSEEEFAEEIAISSIGMGFNNADDCIAIFGKDDIMQGMLQEKVYEHIIGYLLGKE